MPFIKQNFFSGERPRVASHLTKDYEAQIAQNCDLAQGDLRAFKDHTRVQNLTAVGLLNSLYCWKRSVTAFNWIASANELDFARSPVAGEAHNRVYFTGMSEPRVLSSHLMSPAFDFTTDYYKLGVPPPAAAPTINAGYATGSSYRAYIYSYVVKLGVSDAEEGMNSPIAEVYDYGSGNVTLSGFTEPPTGYSIGKIRIYRVAASGSGVADFLFLDEFDTAGIDFSTFSYVDSTGDSGLGEAFPGENWAIPPAGLAGIIAPDGGSLVGFVGNRVYYSEPYMPHAWPYSYPVDSTIIALGWIGGTVVVLTDEYIYLMAGQADAISTTKLPGRFPCLTKAGVVCCEQGVFFPADEGIVLVTLDGPTLFTYEYFTKTQFKATYPPANLRAVYYEGLYLVCNDSGLCFGLNVMDKTLVRLSGNIAFARFHFSLVDDELYFLAQDVDGCNAIYHFCGSETESQEYSYRSKNWILGGITNFSAARILFGLDYDAATATSAAAANAAIIAAGETEGQINKSGVNAGEINADGLAAVAETPSLTFKFYGDGALIHAETVTAETPFRLPGDVMYKRCYFELTGTRSVSEISIATSMDELDAAA